MERLDESIMFRDQQKETLIPLCKQLKYFYYLCSGTGHADFGDSFETVLSYSNTEDLQSKIKLLEFNLSPASNPYEAIPEFPEYKQPGKITINGQNCYVSIGEKRISFSVIITSADGGIEGAFQTCKGIEEFLDSKNLYMTKFTEMENWINCLSPKLYPEFF